MKKALVVALSAALAASLGGCKTVPETTQVEAAPAQPAAPQQAVEVVSETVAAAPAVAPAPVPVVVETPAPVPAPVAKTAPVASAVPALAQNGGDLDPRMGFVGKLINTSSGAKQVAASNNPQAHELHAKAKSLYSQAQASGDKGEVKGLLDEAVKTMYAAIRSASPESVVAGKKRLDFDNRTESVGALMDAHKAVADEKGEQGKHRALEIQVNTLVSEARSVFDAGKLDKGRNILDQAYVMVKTSIESLRGGDTLVRSLNFASKEEEYHYEIDRNDTHRMLVDVLLEEKRKSSPYVAKKVDEFVAKALVERKRAEALAGQGAYEQAIEALEASTKELVRAIRSGGVYIPG